MSPKLTVVMIVVCSTFFALVLSYSVGRHLMKMREPNAFGDLPQGVPGRLILVAGRTVHIVERGDGTALLLVHGTAGSTFDWEEKVMEPLAKHHHVVAIDLFGMGFSERSSDLRYGFQLWADELASVLDTLNIARTSLIGHSLGGAVVACFAATYPDRVDRLISVDSGPWMPPFMLLMLTPGGGEMMLGTAEYWPKLPGASSEYIRRMRQIYLIEGAREALLSSVRGQIIHGGTSYLGNYRKISVPTLLLQGGADPIIPLSAAKSVGKLIPNSRLVVVPGAGHFLMNDNPERFVSEVEKFLTPGEATVGATRED